MKLDTLIQQLEGVRSKHGSDLDVRLVPPCAHTKGSAVCNLCEHDDYDSPIVLLRYEVQGKFEEGGRATLDHVQIAARPRISPQESKEAPSEEVSGSEAAAPC